MKKIRILSCVLLVMCVLFCACANETSNSPEPEGSPIEEPTQSPNTAVTPWEERTEVPTQTPSPTEPANIYAPTREDLNEHDYNAVRSFLEIKDKNGVKNGEKLAAINGLVYNPNDPGTWSNYHDPSSVNQISEFRDIRFVSDDFTWDENGRLCSVSLNFAKTTQSAPVGKLDLHTCGRLAELTVIGLEITEIDVSECDSPKLYIKSCPKLERIVKGSMPFRFLTIEECPSLESFNWVMLPLSDIMQLDHCWWPYDDFQPLISANITVESSDGGYVGVGLYPVPDWSDESLPCYSITATPEEGHEFLGWYDIFGNLVSSNPQLAIQEEETHAYENLVDLIGSTVAHVVARFD